MKQSDFSLIRVTRMKIKLFLQSIHSFLKEINQNYVFHWKKKEKSLNCYLKRGVFLALSYLPFEGSLVYLNMSFNLKTQRFKSISLLPLLFNLNSHKLLRAILFWTEYPLIYYVEFIVWSIQKMIHFPVKLEFKIKFMLLFICQFEFFNIKSI